MSTKNFDRHFQNRRLQDPKYKICLEKHHQDSTKDYHKIYIKPISMARKIVTLSSGESEEILNLERSRCDVASQKTNANNVC